MGLSVMQKAVREAQTEKEEAQRRAAMLALTLDKMQALLEAQVGCDRLKEDRIAYVFYFSSVKFYLTGI